MIQLLPCGTPTLQSTSTGNWTRPANIFGTEQLVDAVISCNTNPSQRGPRADHIPIQLTLEFDTAKAKDEPRQNWRETNWVEFNEHLSDLLTPHPPLPLASEEEFQQSAKCITQAIISTMEVKVPYSRPCPHSKRWWTHELMDLCHQVNDLSRVSYQL
ncbi:hypothetical protein BDR03DRAFT_865928 [Suillus americanus]|nr:hypothetical protein BDR03DRAFT_865928 [Suillus americanus]